MKKLFPLIVLMFVRAAKSGLAEYTKTIRKHDPSLYLGFLGFIGNIASGLWNGVKGAIGGFFGGGGQVTVAGPPQQIQVMPGPPTEPKDEKKPNILLYVGIGFGFLAVLLTIILLATKK